jgi:hypothetical protein
VACGLRTYLKYLNKRLDQHEDSIGYDINEKGLEHGVAGEDDCGGSNPEEQRVPISILSCGKA